VSGSYCVYLLQFRHLVHREGTRTPMQLLSCVRTIYSHPTVIRDLPLVTTGASAISWTFSCGVPATAVAGIEPAPCLSQRELNLAIHQENFYLHLQRLYGFNLASFVFSRGIEENSPRTTEGRAYRISLRLLHQSKDPDVDPVQFSLL